jgi:RNA polymerase sigma-70 factor (ECF subfamily)
MDALSDEALIAEYFLAPASDRSRQFLDELFRRHRARVVAWCYRLTGDRDLAPDLAQEVFVKAYSGLHTFRRDSKFTTWLYSIARNRCRDEMRARAARRREAPEDAMIVPHLRDCDAGQLRPRDGADRPHRQPLARSAPVSVAREEAPEARHRAALHRRGFSDPPGGW